jgi:membrane protein
MSTITLKGFWQILKKAGAGFVKDKVVKLSASLAYYTTFSLGPMIIVIIFLANIFFGKEAIEGTIYGQIRGLVGNAAALQIQEIIKNAAVSGSSTISAVIGIVTLVIGATSVFSEMQDSINMIWSLQVKSDLGWMKMVINRILSFSIVVSLGFLLLVSLIINALLEGFMGRIQQLFPDLAVIIIYIINLLITLMVVSFLFAIIFKVLPDAIIAWSDVAVGSLFTAVLFMIGKFGITLYINKSNVGNAYGASGSLVILLVWVYYTSIILYFGAEFTKAYAVKYGSEIKPDDYAVTVQVIKVEKGKNSVQQNEKEKEETDQKIKNGNS